MTEGRQDTGPIYVCPECRGIREGYCFSEKARIRCNGTESGPAPLDENVAQHPAAEMERIEVVPASSLQEVERERDRAVAAIQADHRHKASIGGSPCVCEWCRALSNPKEGS